jgi:hypothetical protein
MALRNLEPLAAVVATLVVIDAALSPVILLWSGIHLESFQNILGPIANEFDLAVSAYRILTVIVFSVWIYQAGSNIAEAGFNDLDFTPGARIWWYAIPIANLFKPFQGMRELWNASHGSHHYDDNNSLVSAWWALWLVSGVANTILDWNSRTETPSPELAWVAAAISVALAAAAVAMVRTISAAQKGLSDESLDEVFA